MLIYPVTIKLKIIFEKEELENAGFLNKFWFDCDNTFYFLKTVKKFQKTRICVDNLIHMTFLKFLFEKLIFRLDNLETLQL